MHHVVVRWIAWAGQSVPAGAEGLPPGVGHRPFRAVIPPAGLTVERHPGTYAVCPLDREAAVPDWAEHTKLCSIMRTADEPSVVCPDGAVPEDVVAEGGWRCSRVAGPLVSA
jgi:hypothetical protein